MELQSIKTRKKTLTKHQLYTRITSKKNKITGGTTKSYILSKNISIQTIK